MREMKWIIGVNLLFILSWSALVYFQDSYWSDFGKEGDMFFPILYQFSLSIFLSILLFCLKRWAWASAFLFSAIICLAIGASTCHAVFKGL